MDDGRAAPALVAWIVLASGCGVGGTNGHGQDEIVLNREEAFPCVLEFVSEGIRLESDPDGTTPDPGAWVSPIPGGGFVTAIPLCGSIAIWSDRGEFVRTVGRPGEGPGELGITAVPFVDRDGVVHVFDPVGGRWSRFSLDGEFIGSRTSPLLSHVGYGQMGILTAPSEVLISQPYPLATSLSQFRMVDADGSVVREFGEISAGRPPTEQGRSIAFAGGASFWAAPHGGASEYVLEEWSLDGHLLRTIRREVSWLPTGSDDLPRFIAKAGADGRLIVLVVTRFPAMDGFESGEAWYEVLDPEIGEVLASRHIAIPEPAGSDAPPQFGIAPGSSLGFRRILGEFDLPSLEIVRYALSPASNGDVELRDQCF